MAHLSRVIRPQLSLGSRALITSAARQGGDSPKSGVVPSATLPKTDLYCQTGEREVVGYGFNGYATYVDRIDFPCPAVRFKENTPEILELRKKEAGDWKNLSLDEKKQLYRASFCQTFSELNAPTGEWKSYLAAVFLLFSLTSLTVAFWKKFAMPPLPSTITKEWSEASIKKMVVLRSGHLTGVASQFDYEKGDWK